MLTSLYIIGFITLLSGLVAFLGNQLGRIIGKKKMSLFKLRPRHTSIVLTVITGMFISFFTVGLLMVFSKEAREIIIERDKLAQERDRLRGEVETLAQKMQNADIIFNVNEPICIGLVKGGNPMQVKKQIDQILSLANYVAVKRNNDRAYRFEEDPVDENEKIVGYYTDAYKNIISRLSKAKGDWVVIAYSAKNYFYKDKIVVFFNLMPNNLVFEKNQEVARLEIPPASQSNAEIENALAKLLQKVRVEALQKGVLANPVTGSVGDIPRSVLEYAASEIMKTKGELEVIALAASDIYTIGPMDVKFRIQRVTR